MLVLYGERRAVEPCARAMNVRGQALYQLRGIKAWGQRWCLLVLPAPLSSTAATAGLVLQRGRFDLDERYTGLILHSLYLGVMAALITVGVALLLAFARRLAPPGPFAPESAGQSRLRPAGFRAGGVDHARIQLSGPGAGHAAVGRGGQAVVAGSLAALLLAYLVRFIAVAYGPLENSLARIRPALPEAARSLGVSGPLLFCKVYLPLLLPGVLSGALLVFVDVLKEMPATLLMRPFGWDTLAVRIFEMTSEGEWARASLPALMLVLVGLLPVIGLIRRSAYRIG
ncbi:Ferric iron ABC transporter, permease protein [Pseudomonas sp. FEN]|nr:Ferric iron ABC transporter, permease protein [Pseudomonas sp. FEN]